MFNTTKKASTFVFRERARQKLFTERCPHPLETTHHWPTRVCRLTPMNQLTKPCCNKRNLDSLSCAANTQRQIARYQMAKPRFKSCWESTLRFCFSQTIVRVRQPFTALIKDRATNGMLVRSLECGSNGTFRFRPNKSLRLDTKHTLPRSDKISAMQSAWIRLAIFLPRPSEYEKRSYSLVSTSPQGPTVAHNAFMLAKVFLGCYSGELRGVFKNRRYTPCWANLFATWCCIPPHAFQWKSSRQFHPPWLLPGNFVHHDPLSLFKKSKFSGRLKSYTCRWLPLWVFVWRGPCFLGLTCWHGGGLSSNPSLLEIRNSPYSKRKPSEPLNFHTKKRILSKWRFTNIWIMEIKVRLRF